MVMIICIYVVCVHGDVSCACMWCVHSDAVVVVNVICICGMCAWRCYSCVCMVLLFMCVHGVVIHATCISLPCGVL